MSNVNARELSVWKVKPSEPPTGVFVGNNFMTPNWKGYYKLREGWAELSEGRGMSQQPIFGVTVRDITGQDFTPRRSCMFQSYTEAMDYIEELS